MQKRLYMCYSKYCALFSTTFFYFLYREGILRRKIWSYFGVNYESIQLLNYESWNLKGWLAMSTAVIKNMIVRGSDVWKFDGLSNTFRFNNFMYVWTAFTTWGRAMSWYQIILSCISLCSRRLSLNTWLDPFNVCDYDRLWFSYLPYSA